jgi:diguanylate cyclase (GGDEF)-like protein
MTSRLPETVNISLLLGPSFGTLLCAALLAACLWRYQGGPRYRYALCYYLCIGLMLGVASVATDAGAWLLSPPHIIQLLLCLASIAGAALCIALLYPYRPLPSVRATLQIFLGINGLALMATAILPPDIAALTCFASAIGTCLAGAIASALCSITAPTQQQPSPAIAYECRRQSRPLLLFCCAWIAAACGMLMYMLLDDSRTAAGGQQNNALLLGLNLQLILMSLALLDQAWLEHQARLAFQQSATEQARNSSAKLRVRQQRLAMHNHELRQLLRQGDRFDEVTGLLSARALHRDLDREYKTALRYGNTLSLVVLQLEAFKSADEEDAIDTSEECLAAAAQLVVTALQRPGDACGRITSSHIAVVLPYTNTAGAVHVIERIKHGIQQQPPETVLRDVTLRFGVASTETQLARHADDLLESAMGGLCEHTAQPG